MSVTMDLGKVGVLYKGTHDSTQTYEKNDIVMSNGSGYIAKQNVPVGIAISNSSYWGTIVVGADSNVFATKAYTANTYATIADVSALQAAVSSPLVANAVANMTDTEKVYVYTGSETGYTNGNWYYYNGSAWVSGGTYNSQGIGDGSITTAKLANGAVTDAKLAQSGGVLDEVSDLKSDLGALINIPITTTNGYINGDGTIHVQSSDQEVYTNKISVLPTEKYRVRLVYPTNKWMWLVYAQYDVNGNFISRVTVPNSSGNQAVANEVITISADVYSIAFSYRTYGNATFTVSNLQSLLELSPGLSELSSGLSSCNNTISLTESLLANGTILKILSPEYGGFNDAGEEVTSATRIRSGYFENRNKGIYITPKSGYMFGFHTYGGAHTWSGWKTTKTEIPVNESIRLLFDSSPSGSVNPDIDEWNDKFILNTDITAQASQPHNINYSKNIGSISRLGYQSQFPECSIPAYKEAYKNGFRIMLCDVRWTSDNIPVCLHDETINGQARHSNGTVISETIYISDITLEQANEYDWGIAYGDQFAGLNIPTLESVAQFAKWMNCELYVEIKGLPTDTQLESMYDVLDLFNLGKALTFSASYISILETVAPRYPLARLGFGVAPSGISQSNVTALEALKTDVNEVFFHVWQNNDVSGIVTAEILSLLKGTNIGFELTEIQTDAKFLEFISDPNNAYVTRVAIRNKPVENYLYDYYMNS